MKIAIHQNHKVFKHSTMWDLEWVKHCEEKNIDYKIVDCYKNNLSEELKDCDILLWHISQYSLQDMLFARKIMESIENMGIKIFPNHETSWHFDDKIIQSYLLETIKAPIPKFWTFYTYKAAFDFINTNEKFPVVAKLKGGSGSTNVKLIENKKMGIKYIKRMFGRGIKSTPSIWLKAKSNFKTSSSFEIMKKRIKRIPDFIQSVSKAKKLPRESGYVYFQEFVPNEGFDLKVVVVGDKLSFLARDVRSGDFRASGGGSIKYDKGLITNEVRKIAFDINKKLGFQCMGYDFVMDTRDNSAKIVEISYGFSHTAQINLGGYWDKDDNWYDEPLNAPREVLENLIIDSENRTNRVV